MVKTIAVSNPTYRELIKLKEEFDTKNMDQALDTLIANYDTLKFLCGILLERNMLSSLYFNLFSFQP